MGVAGYVAPRHLKAIYDLGHELVAAMDVSDSVGILDKYFPKCQFFTVFERFERYLEKEGREGNKIDYLSICTPNYLHDAHCRFGLRIGADIICEKPLVLNPWNVDALIAAENDFQGKIANILQLRYHPKISALKARIDASEEIHDVHLKYVTPRGPWYDISWKGDMSKSGGIITNIGVHLFDILLWVFGEIINIEEVSNTTNNVSGKLKLKKAKVDWQLSTDASLLEKDESSVRILTCDGQAIDFNSGFDNLHTVCYEKIVKGEIIGPREVRPLIELMWKLRPNPSSN